MINTVIIYWLTVLIIGLVRFDHYRKTSHNVAENHIDVSEYIVFTGLAIFGLIIPLIGLILYPAWSYTVPNWLQIVGIVILVVTVVLFWQTLKTLDMQDSPTLQIKDDHQLITHGVYQYVQHPMYAGGLLGIAAHSLLVPNFISLGSTIIAFLILVTVRIPAEEEMLQQKFGLDYQMYREKTCGLIPELCHFFVDKTLHNHSRPSYSPSPLTAEVA
jgi:protein-S-isoprenylcysteine O-methyltransferase Ste14